MAWAQVLYGSLTGNVSDPSGAPIAGAKVECLNVNTGVPKAAVTDVHGIYLISHLQAGTYSVNVSAPGFATVLQSGIQVDQNTVRRVDVQLKLGTVKETITVGASAGALQTDRSDVHTQITASELADLPGSSLRLYSDSFITIPGVTPPTAEHSRTANPQLSQGFYVNGVDLMANTTRIDGAISENEYNPDSGGLYVPPTEDLEVANMVTNTFNAEQGIAGGTEVDLFIKSGTNEFHGSAWYYNTNNDVDARNFFYYAPQIPKNILNQFGLNLGGPLKRNKAFFFAGWERMLQNASVSGFQTVPNAALRQGNFSGTGTTLYDPTTGNSNGTGRTPFLNGQITTINSTAAKMTALIPLPNTSGGIANDYFVAGDTKFRKDSVDIKINYNPTNKISTFMRYSISPTHNFDPQALGPAGGNTLDGGQPGMEVGRTQNAAIGGTYTISPHLLLDGNIGFTRFHTLGENTDINQNYGLNVLGIPGTNGPSLLQGGYPNFIISGLTSLGNANSSNPFDGKTSEYDENENLTWIKGTHSLRFGGEYFHKMMAVYASGGTWGARGGFTFSGGLTSLSGGSAPNMYNAWGDWLLGLAGAMGKSIVYINPNVEKEKTYAFYVSDQWQVTRKLTAGYGLRYEINPYGYSEHGIGGISYDPASNLVNLGGINGIPYNAGVNTGYGILGPRFGLAYRLTPRTVIRAAYGINANVENFRAMMSYPLTIIQQTSAANSYSAAGSLATGIPAFAPVDLSHGTVPLPTNVGLQTYAHPSYRRGYVEDYNFTIQRDLGKDLNFQAAYVGTRSIRVSTGVNLNAAPLGTGQAGQPLYAKFGNASTITDYMPFASADYNSLQLRLTRRVGKSAVGATYTLSKAMDFLEGSTSASVLWSLPAMLQRNYALAGFDRTHNFEGYWIYDLPFGKDQHWLTTGLGGRIAGGWRLTGILTRTSGLPFTVLSSGASLNAPGSTQTPQQVVPQVQILGGHGPNEPYFNPNAFLPVTTVAFGNSGRNILRGPGLFILNGGLYRTFSLTERFKLQFRVDAYGLTNTPSFGNPSATVSSATFTNGVVTSLNGYDTISSATGQRTVQFALKLTF
jgi:hypothetical protein